MRYGNRSGQGFDWGGLLRACLGVLIVLWHSALPATAHAQQASTVPGTQARRIEVGPGMAGAHIVLVQPGLKTTLLFKASLAKQGVELERRESFGLLEIAEHSVSLVPSVSLKPEELLRLAVRFAAGTEPTGAVFQLMVTSSRGERQVEIVGLPSSTGGGGLLTELLVSGQMDTHGIHSREVPLEALIESSVKVWRATSFHSMDRVAVRLEVQIPEGEPWLMGSAVLANDADEIPLKTWPSIPLPPGRRTLILEGAVGSRTLQENYVLTVHEAGGNCPLFISQLDLR